MDFDVNRYHQALFPTPTFRNEARIKCANRLRWFTGSIFSLCRGDGNKPDDNGSTPLHIAATYGNLDSLELLISYRANLFSLDNNGRTAARVAAFYQKADCCRYLDTLAMRWQASNEDSVSKLQIKAMKDLRKRSKKLMEDGNFGRPKKISYDYSTAPPGTTSSPAFVDPQDRRSSASEHQRNKKLSQEAALRQNFELRPGGKSSGSSEELKNNSAGNTFSNLPRNHTGPLLNSLAELPMKFEKSEEARHSLSQSMDSRPRNKKSLPELELTHGHPTVTLNESALATFLHSLDLADCVQLLHREKLDLDALNMCSEKDLISIGMSLGPRKKILHAITRRKTILAGAGRLDDTEF